MINIIKICSIIIPFFFFSTSTGASPDGLLKDQSTQLEKTLNTNPANNKSNSNSNHQKQGDSTTATINNDLPQLRNPLSHSDKISWQCATQEPLQT